MSSQFQDGETRSEDPRVNLPLAKEQHNVYIQLLNRHKGVNTRLVELPSSDTHPDCCFMEGKTIVYINLSS